MSTAPMPEPVRRRPRLGWIAFVAAAAAAVQLGVAAVGTGGYLWTRADLDTVGKVDFVNPLAIPPLAPSRTDGAGRRVFDLTAQPGRTEFFPGTATDTYGVNGNHLGPTLRASRGETVVVNVRNRLPESTSMHWHGMHLPARMDGGPHQPIAAGQTWSPSWRIDQPAATLWYHPHPHGRTEEQIYRGLAGMVILDDEASRALPLPHRYGLDDIPVIVADKRFRSDRQLSRGTSLLSLTGRLGDTIMVNGTRAPYQEVTTERVRLRLLNASTARVYAFGLADGREVALIGTDGGLLPRPVGVSRVRLSPGERAEIVVTMRPGERVALRSFPPDLGVPSFIGRFSGGSDRLDIMELRAANRLAPSPPLPDALVDLPRLSERDAVHTREFRLAGRGINGESMRMDRIDQTVTRGATEVWEITNDDAPHNFHVHGLQFQVLDVEGRPPAPEQSGWKDTVFAAPGRTTRIIARFDQPADPATPYMYHCHLVQHEDQGMMGQYVVVHQGQSTEPPAVAPESSGAHDHD
jgi:FtsP/CotA-like multicopper oxidase with cupredoxin domain